MVSVRIYRKCTIPISKAVYNFLLLLFFFWYRMHQRSMTNRQERRPTIPEETHILTTTSNFTLLHANQFLSRFPTTTRFSSGFQNFFSNTQFSRFFGFSRRLDERLFLGTTRKEGAFLERDTAQAISGELTSARDNKRERQKSDKRATQRPGLSKCSRYKV